MSTKNWNPTRRPERSVKVKGHTITFSFFKVVWRLILENLPGHEVNRGKHLTIMDLFGLHNWQYLTRGQKTKAGIRKRFGHLRLNQISRQDVQVFHAGLLDEGLSPASADHHIKVLRRRRCRRRRTVRRSW